VAKVTKIKIGVRELDQLLAKSESLTERAYRSLRHDIMSGILEPDTPLRVEHLKKQLGVGSSPIREALSRLAAEGLVVSELNRGFRVPVVTYDDLRDIVAQRKLIECNTLREAILNSDEQWEAEVIAAYHRMTKVEERGLAEGLNPWEEWEERHREFHEALMSGAGSTWASKMLRQLYDQGDRYRRIYRSDAFIVPCIQNDHKLILDAVLARDVDAALAAMGNHVERLNEGADKSTGPHLKPDN
jgi:GntR family carbon starvation induced transcriptional regulator